eukprot:5107069-Amphidinium_carterae.2
MPDTIYNKLTGFTLGELERLWNCAELHTLEQFLTAKPPACGAISQSVPPEHTRVVNPRTWDRPPNSQVKKGLKKC